MKDPLVLFATEWLVETFGFLPIIIIRHPAAYAQSLVAKDWQYHFEEWLAQPAFMDTFTKKERQNIQVFVESPELQNDILEHAILSWDLIYQRVLQYQVKYQDQWVFIKHEELSENPEKEFKQLCEKIDLTFNHSIKAYLNKTTRAKKKVP